MITVFAKQDFNIEEKRIAAGKEIARISTAIQSGTLHSLLSQPHLVELDEVDNDEFDPVNPFDLDLPKCVESLSDEEAEELLRLLAARLDLDNTDPEPDDETITAETLLSDILRPADFGLDVAELYAKADIKTVGQLRDYLAVEGHQLHSVAGIGQKTAAKIANVPGLLIDDEPDDEN